MFLETNSPAAICAALETASGQSSIATHTLCAAGKPTRIKKSPIASGQDDNETLWPVAAGTSIPDAITDAKPKADARQDPHPKQAAIDSTQPMPRTPPAWASGHITFSPYSPTPHVTETIDKIINLHRLRQGIIKAQTKIVLQAQAVLRLTMQSDDDFASDEAKAKARKRTESLYRTVCSDPDHPLYASIEVYLLMVANSAPFRDAYEKALVKLVKQLPVYSWVKSVKGFGDTSFATIVGECGDIGTYKSVSAVWKRMGLAVINGHRQGNPGTGATAEDWIAEGYNKKRRSVSYVAREHVIGGMGKWRPAMGEDVWANEELTYYQQVFADRARTEAVKLDLPVTEAATGKESYRKHVSMRAHRYVEKRLLRNLWIEWRRA